MAVGSGSEPHFGEVKWKDSTPLAIAQRDSLLDDNSVFSSSLTVRVILISGGCCSSPPDTLPFSMAETIRSVPVLSVGACGGSWNVGESRITTGLSVKSTKHIRFALGRMMLVKSTTLRSATSGESLTTMISCSNGRFAFTGMVGVSKLRAVEISGEQRTGTVGIRGQCGVVTSKKKESWSGLSSTADSLLGGSNCGVVETSDGETVGLLGWNDRVGQDFADFCELLGDVLRAASGFLSG